MFPLVTHVDIKVKKRADTLTNEVRTIEPVPLSTMVLMPMQLENRSFEKILFARIELQL